MVFPSSPAAYEAAEHRGPIGRIHQAGERAVTESGLDDTIGYPGWPARNARREPWLSAEVLESLLDSAAAGVGRPAPITNTVERITGHPARSPREWVAENRADFVG